MKRFSWFVLTLFLASSSIRPALRAEITIGNGAATPPPAADTGSAVAAGEDVGAGVEEFKAPKEEENKWMPWVLGIGSAVVALVGGFLIADSNSSDAEDAADAAAASAAAQSASSAAAAAAQAAANSNTTAAVQAAAADAQAALTAATDPTGPFPNRLFITGTFVGDQQVGTCGPWTPTVTFNISQKGNFPGGITDFTSATVCGSKGKGGDWEQVSEFQILIRVDEIFYLGRANLRNGNEIVLANGALLRATAGSGYTSVPKE